MRALWSVAATAAAAGAIVAPAAVAVAQPAEPRSPLQTIQELEAQGYDVNIDRVGSAPINQCVVTSVRNPQEVTQTFVIGDEDDREVVTVVVSKSISVSLNCER